MRTACVLAFGTELTLGQTIDTNSGWLAAELAALGVRCIRMMTVADESGPTRDALREAAGLADVVVATGGLGPTADDLMRVALADAAGVPLELHGPSLEQLRLFFASRQRALPERNAVQAQLPRGATALPNACGTAPGILLELLGTPVFCLPGVPHEMKAMFAAEVAPRVQAATRGAVLVSRTLHTCGLGESDVGQRLADLMQRGRNPEIGTAADLGIVGVRINAHGADAPAAARLLDVAEAEIRRRLGTAVFGGEGATLAGAVGDLLAVRGQRLSTAESCTGGLIGALLTDVAGASRYYVGGVVAYANALKAGLVGVPDEMLQQAGAVSEPVAAALARGIAARCATEFGLGVTGIAGPDGGTPDKPVGLVYIGLQGPAGTQVQRHLFGAGPRAFIRTRAARVALNWLRLTLAATE